MRIQHNITKNVSFKRLLLTFQNAKTHPKLLLWRNRITSPKTCILSVLSLLHTKTPKNMQRGNEKERKLRNYEITKGNYEKRVL